MSSATPCYCRPEAFRLFQEQLPDIDSSTSRLFRAAFAICLHEMREAQLAETETVVDNLADAVSRRASSQQPKALLAHLHDLLFEVFNLRGNSDDFYTPENSYLPEVLRSRRGIPISLVLVYKRVAEPLGLIVYGVNAPGHFLAEVQIEEVQGLSSIYVDPFYGGDMLNRQEVFARIEQATGEAVQPSAQLLSRATHRQWLARMLTNLQAVFASSGRDRDVWAMQELQSLLSSHG